MLWHKDRFYDLVYDIPKHSLHFPVVLPNVSSGPMYEDFKRFVASHQAVETLEHRRIDKRKIRISCSLKKGIVSLLFIVKDDDFEYATKNLIHLVNEVFMVFLRNGLYYEYTIETFEIDRDQLAG